MDISLEKSNIHGEVAALRVSAEGYVKKKLTNSIESISQKANSLDFLIELSKVLNGVESLKETLIDALTHNLTDIELDIKQALKLVLKGLVSCSINPSLPQSFIDDGITLELSRIDLLNMFKVDPTTKSGKLLYNDVTSGSNSTDFNTFLYNVVQDNGGYSYWGNQTTNNDILGINFSQESTSVTLPNNTINIKPSSFYSNKSLTDINNDYIDSLKLFESNKLINNIIESVFGSISLDINKDKVTIQNEIKIQEIIDRIINTDEDIVIDDSYFQFNNRELSNIEYKSELRRKGMSIVATCGNVESTIPIDSLVKLNSDLDLLNEEPNTPQLLEIKTNVVRNGLNLLAEDSANNVGTKDKFNVKLNFIEEILKNLMSAIVGVIISPKLIVILSLNHSIIHGTAFTDIEDFMEKNKTLINSILQVIRDIIIKILMDRILKEIKILVSENVIKTKIETFNSKKAQLASFVAGKKAQILNNR